MTTPEAFSLRECPRVCFFAHHDPDGHVGEHVIHYVTALAGAGFAVVFVTTSTLKPQATAAISPLCHAVLARANEGLDFGSWAAAFGTYADELRGDLLLANDSVYGPIGSLQQTLDTLVSQDADWYGLVENLEPSPHLQSWFLLLRPQVYRSDAFRAVIRLPFGRMAKREIIEDGEIGLTRALTSAGFRYAAAFRPSRIGPLWKALPFNPAQLLWRELVDDGIVPFLKVEVLRDNPMELPDINAWPRVVERGGPSLVQAVEAHLDRIAAVAVSGQAPPVRMLGRIAPDPVVFLRREFRLARAGRDSAVRMNAAIFGARQTLSKLAFRAKRAFGAGHAGPAQQGRGIR